LGVATLINSLEEPSIAKHALWSTAQNAGFAQIWTFVQCFFDGSQIKELARGIAQPVRPEIIRSLDEPKQSEKTGQTGSICASSTIPSGYLALFPARTNPLYLVKQWNFYSCWMDFVKSGTHLSDVS